MRALRVTGRRVYTAARTLTHPVTGRSVMLLGTMHIGHAGYFSRLSRVLARHQATGAEIHVEGISSNPRCGLSAWECERLDEVDSWADPETAGAAAALLSLDSQGANLRVPAGARNIDFTQVELLRRVGEDNFRRLLAPQPASPGGRSAGGLVRAALRFQMRHGRALRGRRVNRVVITERNRLAFVGATDALTRGDVVLVWGADHVPGLTRLFRASGYRVSAEDWFEACAI